ncbi:FHA domain protein [Yoonia maricola]|uniref:FHA domain protein n=1 Tax=Yoonia maricola TaxID=420999 RepID=A0A2M8W007_9RHOB|nr:type VI secretion system-associated FHA domain protein TagH [Yoonia maricola]PJI84249.1 FHA domain protein [Yoonia maricola]
MITLTLRIDNHATLENGGPVSLVLSGEGAQVGRKAGNDWVLPDPSRHISGHHFDVSYENGNYVLTDVSSNGTFLHGERYRIEGGHVIADSERFTVGHYIIVAHLQTAEAPVPPPQPPVEQPVAPAPYAVPPAAPAAMMDEFDDVWGDIGTPARDTGSLQSAPNLQQAQPYPHAVVQAPGGPSARVTGAPQLTSPPVFGTPDRATSAGQLSTPPAFGAPPPLQGQVPPAPGIAPASPAPEPAPAFGAPPQPYADPAPQQHPPIAPDGGDLFMRGFLEGAGLTDPTAVQIPPEVLGRMLGATVRVATNEVMQMLKDRAAVKLFVSNEDRTMRVATGNNPMKFMLDPDQAFETLFLKPRDGYQTGPDGFENALGDIRRHQSAVIAALQPALAELLEGLSPPEIEADISGGLMGGGARKSWEEFEKRWERRALEGENGMLDAFIKSFSRHYANALQKL